MQKPPAPLASSALVCKAMRSLYHYTVCKLIRSLLPILGGLDAQHQSAQVGCEARRAGRRLNEDKASPSEARLGWGNVREATRKAESGPVRRIYPAFSGLVFG